MEALQEIIARHDSRGLMDYVTCGTGSYFEFTGIIPNVFFPDKLGVPYAEALKKVVNHAKGTSLAEELFGKISAAQTDRRCCGSTYGGNGNLRRPQARHESVAPGRGEAFSPA